MEGNIEAPKAEAIKTQTLTYRHWKILAIVLFSVSFLLLGLAVAVTMYLYFPVQCTDNEACRNSRDFAGCGCGRQKVVTHRIVGGLSTTDGEWPFQVSLQHHGQHFCGATLVSCRWIVSAAHCFENRNEDSLTAVFGVHYLNKEMNPNVQIRTIRKIIIHPDANFSTTDYDVALLELTTPIHYTDFVQPACLPPATPLFTDGQYCIIIGWGKISENGASSNELLKTEVKLFNNSDCEALTSQTITRQMMCAGVLEGGKDTCQGDSGGPLLCQDVDSRLGYWQELFPVE
ncbi:transmembrane protease serine 9 [Callorhinchus milii]|uniref:transmembrane protease serine 9 n=1 Tax=Callorhinchus milii TaxID=7868 RepID=UPI001C3F5293|nr:transmembrane protease serine 9 [Callorhinchus milii]